MGRSAHIGGVNVVGSIDSFQVTSTWSNAALIASVGVIAVILGPDESRVRGSSTSSPRPRVSRRRQRCRRGEAIRDSWGVIPFEETDTSGSMTEDVSCHQAQSSLSFSRITAHRRAKPDRFGVIFLPALGRLVRDAGWAAARSGRRPAAARGSRQGTVSQPTWSRRRVGDHQPRPIDSSRVLDLGEVRHAHRAVRMAPGDVAAVGAEPGPAAVRASPRRR